MAASSSRSGAAKATFVKKCKFTDLGVSRWLVDQCKQVGIVEPTAVQCACIAPILAGDDVIGCAKTGTGKTLAFALPIVQALAEDPYGVFALVLTPTRELAFQINDQFQVIGKPIGLRTAVIVGGRDMVEQDREISRRPHVLIATPGRLADHIESGHELPLDKLRFFVIDEADRMLDGQYALQLKTIFGKLPKQRQTLLFSATMTDALGELHQLAMQRRAFFWEDPAIGETATVGELDQRYVLCPVDVKDAYLVYVVKAFVERPENAAASVLVFAHTCRECQALSDMFRTLGVGGRGACAALHSMVSQRERLAALARFRSAQVRILVATDVAARGLDITGVDLVVNHNVPAVAKNYVHRVGRAARAGRRGTAVTFVTQYDVGLVGAIEKHVKLKLVELKVSDAKVSQYVTEVLVAKREAEIRLDERNFGERRELNRRKQMLIEGVDPDDLSRLAQRERKRTRATDAAPARSRRKIDRSK